MKATKISKYIPGAQAKITTYQKKIIATKYQIAKHQTTKLWKYQNAAE